VTAGQLGASFGPLILLNMGFLGAIPSTPDNRGAFEFVVMNSEALEPPGDEDLRLMASQSVVRGEAS